MATKKDPLKHDIETLRADVTRLRDEIRVRLHLGAMDARDTFAEIERDLEHGARDVSQTTRRVLETARTRLRELADAFREPPAPSAGKHA